MIPNRSEIKFSLIAVFTVSMALMAPSIAWSQHTKGEFQSKELSIQLSDGITVNGTILETNDNRQDISVILVSPPMSPDRNLSTAQNAPGLFRHLAEKLAGSGYNVFRFDNRGQGTSGGKTDSVSMYTHANDLKEIIRYFKSGHSEKMNRICLMGFSEGGAVSEIVASEPNAVSLLVLLSTQAYGGYPFWRYQAKKTFDNRKKQFGVGLMDSMFVSFDKISKPLFEILEDSTRNDNSIKAALTHFYNSSVATDTASRQIPLMTSQQFHDSWLHPHQIAHKRFKPEKYLGKITCPVLALCGTLDDRINYEISLPLIKKILTTAGNSNVETVALPNVNHSYRTLTNGTVWELADKNEIFSGLAFDHILEWLRKQ